MTKVRVAIQGKQEFDALVDEIINDFGIKDAKKILQRAAQESMRTVLESAKNRAPVDTGQLRASLRLRASKPNNRDKRSKYVNPTDTVIASVATSNVKQLRTLKFKNQKNTTNDVKQIGGTSDARVIAMEFGTAKVAAKPFLRPALEQNRESVLGSLKVTLKAALERYKAKQAKKRG